MTRFLYAGLAIVSVTCLLSAQTLAGPLFRLRLPKINMGKAAKAAIYPVTKSAVNGGKTVFKTAVTAVGTAGTVASLAPSALGGPANFVPSRWNGVAQKIIIGAAKR